MSRFREALDNNRKEETVINFMGGESFQISPLDTLKMITASSIFGEPSYYRDGGLRAAGTKVRQRQNGGKTEETYTRHSKNNRPGRDCKDARYWYCGLLEGQLLFGDAWDGRTTTEIMEQAIDDALTADFAGTLKWAATLRDTFSIL